MGGGRLYYGKVLKWSNDPEFFPLWFLSNTFVQIVFDIPICPNISHRECYISQKCNGWWRQFSQGRLSPEAPSSFLLYMPTAIHLDPLRLIFICPNIQMTDRKKYYSMVHLQYRYCCSLESPSRKTPYVWPPETSTVSCPRFPSVIMSKTPQ